MALNAFKTKLLLSFLEKNVEFSTIFFTGTLNDCPRMSFSKYLVSLTSMRFGFGKKARQGEK